MRHWLIVGVRGQLLGEIVHAVLRDVPELGPVREVGQAAGEQGLPLRHHLVHEVHGLEMLLHDPLHPPGVQLEEARPVFLVHGETDTAMRMVSGVPIGGVGLSVKGLRTFASSSPSVPAATRPFMVHGAVVGGVHPHPAPRGRRGAVLRGSVDDLVLEARERGRLEPPHRRAVGLDDPALESPIRPVAFAASSPPPSCCPRR